MQGGAYALVGLGPECPHLIYLQVQAEACFIVWSPPERLGIDSAFLGNDGRYNDTM